MGKARAKQEVTEFYLSQHFGICTGPDVTLLGITVKEKEAWAGLAGSAQALTIDNADLFGGPTKEGGVRGTAHWLPGDADQLLPDTLAQKLGRADGASCPGFRGLASLFFFGAGGRGFYWTANSPYLPGVWTKVQRKSAGLDPDKALIGEGGGNYGTTEINVPGTDFYSPPNTTTLTGFTTDQILTVSKPLAADDARLTWDAASYWSDDAGTSPPAPVPGQTYGNALTIYGNAGAGDVVLFSVNENNGGAYYANAAAAYAAFAASFPLELTGYTTYKFVGFNDIIPSDNRGGLSILIEHPGANELDANPANIIYESLTNTDWGMGAADTALDIASFEAVQDTLFSEGFGLSMIWTRQSSIQDFIQEVLDHIQAVLYVDPSTGLLTLSLIRGDYDAETLPELTPDNADLSSFSRKLWGDIVNEIIVSWTNPENEQDETITVQDLASAATQGGIVSDSRNYYGVRNAALAQSLAMRDLRSAGQPLATCEAEVDRTQWRLRPASVIKLTWPEYGVADIVMRVTSVNYGKPGDPTIKLSLIEDVYGLDIGAYEDPPSTEWEDPTSEPAPLETVEILTLPLFFALQTTVAEFIDSPEYPEVVAGVLATTANSDTYGYELWDELPLPNGTLEWRNLGFNNIIGHAELDADLDAEAASTGITFDNFMGQTTATVAGFVFIGAEGETGNEIAMIETVDSGTGAASLTRGVLDTVPRAWPSGTPVWFVDASTLFEDSEVRASGEAVDYKLRSRTSQGLLPLASAPLETQTLTDRPWLPSRPANVLVYGEAWSSEAAPIDAITRPDPWVTVSWSNRNRLTEDSQVLGWTDATVTPEVDQTTTIEVRETDGTLITTHDALTGTSFDVPDASFGGKSIVRVRVASARSDTDGDFVSLQYFEHWLQIKAVSFDSTDITFDDDTHNWDEG